jgi:hypothetical protein
MQKKVALGLSSDQPVMDGEGESTPLLLLPNEVLFNIAAQRSAHERRQLANSCKPLREAILSNAISLSLRVEGCIQNLSSSADASGSTEASVGSLGSKWIATSLLLSSVQRSSPAG